MADAAMNRAAVPMLSYEDVGAAAEWLCDAFGFSEVGERFTDDRGRVNHAEIEREGALVYLGWPEPYGRLYNAADLEGHRWMFMSELR